MRSTIGASFYRAPEGYGLANGRAVQRYGFDSASPADAQTEETETMTTSISTIAKVDNGVNVTALLGAREALEKAPEAAQFKWRASCEWLHGTHSRSTISSFFGLGTE